MHRKAAVDNGAIVLAHPAGASRMMMGRSGTGEECVEFDIERDGPAGVDLVIAPFI